MANSTQWLAGMSLADLAGQTLIVGFDGLDITPELQAQIQEQRIGGVTLFGRNVESPKQVALLTTGLQAAARQAGLPGLLIAIDQEGGVVARLREAQGFSEFPSAMATAATGDPENARRIARAIATELAALGINTDYAPVLDVNNNAANPIISTRSYGGTPKQVSAYGTAFLEAMQAAGIAACGKHFPGHGDTSVDSHFGLPMVPHARARLDAIELPPFRSAMQAGLASIMSAHIVFPAVDATPGLAATLSRPALAGLLRGELGFDGLIFTDSLEMGALASSGYPAPLAAAMALQAGADALLFNRGVEMHRAAFERIQEWAQDGRLPQARLEDAAGRVLAFKERFRMLEPESTSVERADSDVGTEMHRALGRSVAAQAVTLLRDDAGWLPLRGEVLVFETPLAGGLASALSAAGVPVSLEPEGDEVARLSGLVPAGATAVVATADVGKYPRQAGLVRALLRAGVRTVVVAMRSPYDLLHFAEAPAYLALYGACAPVLEAAAAVLRGDAPPLGRLPVELPGLYQPGAGLVGGG